MAKAPVISVSHGGGPMPILGDPAQAELAASMRTRVPSILKLKTEAAPRAIVLVTAHWETDVVTISSAEKHDLLYDYYGFPPEAYEIRHPAPGSNEVAELVRDALKKQNMMSKMDEHRGWDHGVFVPMALVDPSAFIPIVQVSVLRSQSPDELFKTGQALAPLRDQNIAIIGSGSASFHNLPLLLQSMSNGLGPKAREKHVQWNDAIEGIILEADATKRREGLLNWRDLDSAYDAHPRNRAEHFSPLIVCAGAGGNGKASAWSDLFAGYEMRSYYWS